MKMIIFTIWWSGGRKKRCIYHQLDVLTVCSVIYMQGPGDWKCSCQAFNKLDSHLFLHDKASLHRSNREKTGNSQALCTATRHLNS